MRYAARAQDRSRLVAAIGTLFAATSTNAQPSVDLTGVVRDFRKAHADFNAAAATLGHYAGSVELALSAGSVPVYDGGGFRVATQWMDTSGRNIAPNLFGTSTGSCMGSPIGVSATSDCDVRNQSEVWGYVYGSIAPGGIPAVLATNCTTAAECVVLGNSEVHGNILVGVGGNPNTVVDISPNSDVFGTLGNLSAPLASPVFAAPTGLGPSTGNLLYNSGTSEIGTNLHVGELRITSSARVVIKPGTHVVIYAESGVWIDANANANCGLFIGAGASLDLYVRGEMNLLTRAEALDLDPSRFRIFMLNDELNMAGNAPSRLRAQVFAKGTNLEMTQSAQFWGTFWGGQLDMENSCKAYIDMSFQKGDLDSAGVAGAAGGSITSAATFSEWFADVPGTNLSKSHSITMINNGSGIFEYLDDAFFPIDGNLFGDEWEPNNNNFTYAIDATFTYASCGGQFVDFRGADDFWLFIDGALVMDLGGVQSMTTQYLALDRLNLAAGPHQLKLFYAQRRPGMATFRLRTNVVLATVAAPFTVTEACD